MNNHIKANKKFKVIYLLVVMLILMVSLMGCKKKSNSENQLEDQTVEPTVTEAPLETVDITPTLVPADDHTGDMKSKLSGEWVSKKVGNKRPYAIMFNNIEYASPQSGTSEASILYEARVEGGITRLMGVFEKLNKDRIGSIRSARHYFVSFADEYDAIFVHYGHTSYAMKKIEALGVNNLSGLSGIGTTVFYRDKSIKAPHNAFTSKEGILKGTKALGYNTEYDKDYEGHFSFFETDTDIQSNESVVKITLPFSNSAVPYLTYNQEDKLYYRFQFGKEHIDKNTGKQLAYKNVIVQLVKEWDIDKNGYQTMDLENASGNGYYITNGKKIDITWKKNESTRKMRYYDSQGNELMMNPGKTYIAVFPKDRINKIVLSDSLQ